MSNQAYPVRTQGLSSSKGLSEAQNINQSIAQDSQDNQNQFIQDIQRQKTQNQSAINHTAHSENDQKNKFQTNSANVQSEFNIDRQEYQQVFQVFDKNNTGEIQVTQVYELINKFDQAAIHPQVGGSNLNLQNHETNSLNIGQHSSGSHPGSSSYQNKNGTTISRGINQKNFGQGGVGSSSGNQSLLYSNGQYILGSKDFKKQNTIGSSTLQGTNQENNQKVLSPNRKQTNIIRNVGPQVNGVNQAGIGSIGISNNNNQSLNNIKNQTYDNSQNQNSHKGVGQTGNNIFQLRPTQITGSGISSNNNQQIKNNEGNKSPRKQSHIYHANQKEIYGNQQQTQGGLNIKVNGVNNQQSQTQQNSSKSDGNDRVLGNYQEDISAANLSKNGKIKVGVPGNSSYNQLTQNGIAAQNQMSAGNSNINQQQNASSNVLEFPNGKESLNFEDFISLINESCSDSQMAENYLVLAFSMFDRQKKGYISTEDLKEVFEILGESITDEEVNTMIKIAGIKSNDKINFKEFVDFFYKID